MKTFEHGGNIHKIMREGGTEDVLDFSANINPLGPPEWMRPLISSQLESLVHYPDPENTQFVEAIASHTGLDTDCIVVGNGTTELLYTYMRVLPCKRVLIPVPCYVDYTRAAKIAGLNVENFVLSEEEDFVLNLDALAKDILPGDLVVIATPNNPTGRTVARSELLQLTQKFSDSFFLIDEAFLDFIEGASTVGGSSDNVVTINSMTKFYGIPGLRIGYGILPPALAKKVKDNMPPWTVNSLAQAVGIESLKDEGYQRKTRQVCTELRKELFTDLEKIEQLKVYFSEANYLFVKMLSGGTVPALSDHLLAQGIMIRRCENYKGLQEPERFFRIAVRTKRENSRLVQGLFSFFNVDDKAPRSTAPSNKKAGSIMFQGTCSDAGKSIITSALCRILCQDGVKVAPFKAQNMSLNSFVTLQGDEMGRAQVVQAQAARLDPDCRMNPILLKPNSDTGSQIIVSGKPVGNMSVLAYNDFKPKVWGEVCKSYDSLAGEFDVVVLEGAGSPGEVNLKADDIVNMKMAEYAQSPVILVGDIDRGGVYSSFVGIMEVLAEWERQLVAGFLVNKFRGQASLLDSAHSYVQMHTGREVFGVVPYLKNLGLPEEDSVSFKKGSFNTSHEGDGVEIAVINLPHISNFTDVEPFLEEPDVTLRIVERVEDLGEPAAIILPGSKNVIHDLQFLHDKDFIQAIKRSLEKGSELVGICGGYQMLGRTIKDPHKIESDGGELQGLGLLDMETVIELDKNLIRKNGIHQLSGQEVFGYEIHHGISSQAGSPLLKFSDGTGCGTGNSSNMVWGCYLHGIFDGDHFRRWFIDGLRVRVGLKPVQEILAPYDLEGAFDRLADCVRENVDMDSIYRLLKI